MTVRILQALKPVRCRGRRFPRSALVAPPLKSAAALVADGAAVEVATAERPEDLVFRVRLVMPWTSGRGRTYGSLQVVRVGWRELQERPAAVELVSFEEDADVAALPAEALPGRPPAKLARAVEWLRVELEAAGGSARASDLKARAGRARIRPRTLGRARHEVGVQIHRRERVTWWRMP